MPNEKPSQKEQIIQASKSPISTLLSKVLESQIAISVAKVLTQKKLETESLVSEIARIVKGKFQMLDKIDKRRKTEVGIAKGNLTDMQEKLLKKIEELKESIQTHINHLNMLTEKYLTPLLNKVEENISPIRNDMISDFKHVLADDDVKNKLAGIAKAIGFNLNTFVKSGRKSPSDDVKYIESLRSISVDSSDKAQLVNNFCNIVEEDNELAPYSALIRELHGNPVHEKHFTGFLEILSNKKALDGTDFLEKTAQNLSKVKNTVSECLNSVDMDFDKLASEINKDCASIHSGVSELNNMVKDCRTGSDLSLNAFNDYPKVQSFYKPFLSGKAAINADNVSIEQERGMDNNRPK